MLYEVYAMIGILAILAILNTYLNRRTRIHLDIMVDLHQKMINTLNERCTLMSNRITTAHDRISISNEIVTGTYESPELEDAS